MITEIEIENYKSIRELTLPLGRINVFIGENGAGKSNILEAIALFSAAAANKLDHEFLSSRGIRVTAPAFMRPAFPDCNSITSIRVMAKTGDADEIGFKIDNDNSPYSKWTSSIIKYEFGVPLESTQAFSDFINLLQSNKTGQSIAAEELEKTIDGLQDHVKIAGNQFTENAPLSEFHKKMATALDWIAQAQYGQVSNTTVELSTFVIFSPENSALRMFIKEGQIEPLGINGEGLLKLLSFYASQPNDPILSRIKRSLKLFDWFDDFNTESVPSEARLLVQDRYLDLNVKSFDHRSANEGFFFLLFYFLLFNSKLTPKFFAIDNIDASLNPKLCEQLVRELSKLAKENDKQAILTTHNPAVLDGLDLNDDEQRLFVVSRGRDGATKVKRIHKPEPVDGNTMRLSEMFIRGLIGGLPKGF